MLVSCSLGELFSVFSVRLVVVWVCLVGEYSMCCGFVLWLDSYLFVVCVFCLLCLLSCCCWLLLFVVVGRVLVWCKRISLSM